MLNNNDRISEHCWFL